MAFSLKKTEVFIFKMISIACFRAVGRLLGSAQTFPYNVAIAVQMHVVLEKNPKLLKNTK